MLRLPLRQKNATPIPAGFRQIRIKKPGERKGHTYIECCAKIHTKNGDFDCSFSKRKDKLPKDVPLEEALAHRCFNNNLDRYLSEQNENDDLSIAGTGDLIETKLAILTGRHGISLEAAVGKLMRNLLLTAIKIGQQNPSIEGELLLPVLNRKSFTKSLIKKGKELYDEYKEQYLKYKFISLNVDGGKLGSTNYFDVIITNALLQLKPIIFKAYSHFRGNKFNYKEKLNEAIEQLQEEGFVVAGIVSDDLRVQVNSILEISLESHFLFHVSCGNHCVHNAIKDAFDNNGELGKMLKNIEQFVDVMNRKDVLSKTQIAVPKRCTTRWTNVYDIALFIVKHYETFKNFVNDVESYSLSSMQSVEALMAIHEILSTQSFILTLILLPLKLLSLKLESDKTTCGNIFGFEYSALIKLTQLGIDFEQIAPYCNELAHCIKQRLAEKHDSLQNRIAFLLTPKGRLIEIMLENSSPPAEVEAAFVENFPLSDSNEEEIIKYCKEKIQEEKEYPLLTEKIEALHKSDSSESENESENESEQDSEIESDNSETATELADNLIEEEEEESLQEEDRHEEVHQEEVRQEEGHQEEEEDQEEIIEETDFREEFYAVDYEQRLIDQEADEEMTNVTYQNYAPITEPEMYTIDDYGTFLIENCPKLGLDGEKASLALTKWLSSPSTLSMNMLLHVKSQDILDLWLYFQKIDEFHDLATFAQILLTNTASEASCEREFWKQRKILTNEKNRTGHELAFARIVYMTLDDFD